MKVRLFAVALMWLAPAAAWSAALPTQLSPPAPFPRILQQAPTIETIAPGIEYGEYLLRTQKGPLTVHVVAISSTRRDVRVGEVQAQNALVSRGETIGSMAKRTGAVAGINGDYFDIGNTNRPLNIVVRDGALLQMPSRRYALAVAKDGTPKIAEFTFSGEVELGGRTFSLDGFNQMPPPNGGISLLTPQFGSVAPGDNITLISLQPLGAGAPLTRYRVIAIADNLKTQPPGFYVAVGINAYGALQLPSEGDVATVNGDLSPLGLASLAEAIGGGPLILHDARWYEDSDGPSGGEYERSIPSSGAAIASDGTLLLMEVDGRQPARSVGLTRHEFSALMRAFGANEGMSFDGGGSSTIVARRLGDSAAEVVNAPSDGVERPVANGIFAYSTDPVGPPVKLIAQPAVIRAVPGAQLHLRVAALDAANHVAATPAASGIVEPSTLGTFHNGEFTARGLGNGRIVLHGGALRGEIAVEVQSAPDRIEIEPLQPNVETNGTLALSARALDRYGYILALPPLLRWSTKAGSIDAFGHFRAGAGDADVTLHVGTAIAAVRVTVGSHESDVGFVKRARFATIPRGGEGSLTPDPQCAGCIRLTYSFSTAERAAYATADVPLPAGTIGVAFDVQDDGGGGRLRIALRNAINESLLLDATGLERPGWRRVVVRFPAGVEASKLIALYLLPPRGMQLSSGAIVLRNVRAIVAGR